MAWKITLRITKELQESYQQPINHKVVQRLLQIWDLALMRQTQAPKPSQIRQVIVEAGDGANRVAQLAEIAPFQVAYTDFTELRYANGQKKAYLMPIIGHPANWSTAGQSAHRPTPSWLYKPGAEPNRLLSTMTCLTRT